MITLQLFQEKHLGLWNSSPIQLSTLQASSFFVLSCIKMYFYLIHLIQTAEVHLGEHRTWLSQKRNWRREGEACVPVSKLAATYQLLLVTFFFNCGCQMPVFPLLFRIASRKQNFNQDFVFRSLFSLKLLIKSCKITSKLDNCEDSSDSGSVFPDSA